MQAWPPSPSSSPLDSWSTPHTLPPLLPPPLKSELAFLLHELGKRSFQGEFWETYVKFTNDLGLRVWLTHLSPSPPLSFLSRLPSFPIVFLSVLPLVFTFTTELLN